MPWVLQDKKENMNMKKTFVMICLLAVLPLTGFSEAVSRSDISKSERGHLVLEKKQENDGLASYDRILLLRENTEDMIVFDSEGRFIQNVIEEDLDGDSIPELLIQMDLGGSGGFRELALLRYDSDRYATIWEETGFTAGEAVIEDRDGDGRKSLYIDYTDTEQEPPVPATAILNLENGEITMVSSQAADKK